ncbi:MAG TPA: transglutaminase-like domain-containing protein [Bryobacteraceae bacterium]|nr:transglutaminase-like domain-containing protein [Bryobacteraceae bacterium]
MRELGDLLARHDESIPLDVAALQLATIEYPNVTAEPFRALLDSYARELGERVPPSTDGEEFVGTFNEFLFDELGFEGNEDDYYDPANSCLNEVLTRRKGIPITLSVVCMEIGRRLERPLFGIGLPGHFIVKYDDGIFSTYIDAFSSGQLLLDPECYDLARRATGLQLESDPALLVPVGTRQIILRMLNNLRSAYYLRQEPQKALKVLDLLIQADPLSAEEYKQRGIFRARLHLYQSARADLETYLKLAPDAPDREEVAKQLHSLQSWLRNLQ